MKWLFDYDGVVGRVINRIVDSLLLSILWLLFSIPIITVGASTAALFHTANQVIRKEEGYLWREFWHSFKSNFKQATMVWILQIVIGGFFTLYFYCGYQLLRDEALYWAAMNLLRLILILVFIWLLYWIPYITRFTDTTKTMMKNCAKISLGNILWSILNILVFAAALVLIWRIPISILVVPTVWALAENVLMDKVFSKYVSEESEQS